MNNNLNISVDINRKVEKYADGVSQADIDSGRAVPYETIEFTETLKGQEALDFLNSPKGES